MKMKFKDIPQLMKAGPYQVDMPLDYFIKWLDEEQKNGLDLNPDFQRGHVWSREQQIAYVEFLLRGGQTARTLYFNCPQYRTGARPEGFVCVDGLQRITAIQKFMNNENPAFGAYYKSYEDPIPFDVGVVVNINELESREDVLRWYIEMNEGGTPHTQEEIDRVKDMLRGKSFSKKLPNKDVIGKIEWLNTYGQIREAAEYTSVYQFVKDALEEDYYGVPVVVTIHMTEEAKMPEGVSKIIDDYTSGQTRFKVILNPLNKEEVDDTYKVYEVYTKTFDKKTECHHCFLNEKQLNVLKKVMDMTEYACYSLKNIEGKEFNYEFILDIKED